MHMNATAADIFVDEGGRKSAEANSAWDVYDLWANRMPDHVANQVLKANSTAGISGVDKYYYNATAMSYADGIAANHTLLMGTKVRYSLRFGLICSLTMHRSGLSPHKARSKQWCLLMA
jgi:alpha-galactosidase